MNFWPEFIRLKTAVGGNREQTQYEETFGMPMEEKAYITSSNADNRRILSETEFAIRLNEENKGRFDDAVGAALRFLRETMDRDGVWTKDTCDQAEKLLMPCREEAKTYKLILAGHSHIDMDWMWPYNETVALTLSTFHTVIRLMDQYPEFCFSQSQASVYRIVEEYDQELMAEIKKRIAEGRWEVTASAWTESDHNMPSTESLLHHIECTKRYLRDTWGVDPDSLQIDFTPDSFGHSRFLPDIDLFGGVKYMYHCRGLDGDNSLYRWRSPSGRELMCYREQYWYNSGITPKIGLGIFDIARTCAGFRTGLIVYGVGDHGGGPTRRDIETALDMQAWPIWPAMKFGTFAEFFHEAEKVRDQLPVIDQELNFLSTGCYTSQSRIKKANRQCERAMYDAEFLSAFAQNAAGRAFSRSQSDEAWRRVLYAQFHDLLPGSCTQPGREYVLGEASKTLAYAQTQFSQSVQKIAAEIDTSWAVTEEDRAMTQAEGAGGGFNMRESMGMPQPSAMPFQTGFRNGFANPELGSGMTRVFHLFNTAARSGKTVTELTVWDWMGDLRRIRFQDEKGNLLRFQLIDQKRELFWDHMFFRVLTEAEIPAFGYTTVILREAEAEFYPLYRQPPRRTEHPFENPVLENELVRAEFDIVSGGMISFVDKQTGKEYIQPGDSAHLTVVEMETASTSGWNLGRYIRIHPMTAPVTVEQHIQGPLLSSFTTEYRWGSSTLKLTPILHAGEKLIRFCVQADWHETFGTTTPLLTFDVPLAFRTDRFQCDVPGGAVYRQPRGQDIPCLQYCAAIDGQEDALALISDTKYGYRAQKGQLSVSLINTSKAPDPYPDRGLHTVNLALALEKNEPRALENIATAVNHPAYYLSAAAHPGKLPPTMAMMDFQAETSVLSAVMPTEKPGAIRVRFYETAGKADHVSISFLEPVKVAVCVDPLGRPAEGMLTVEGNTVVTELKPCEIREIEIEC